MLHWQQPTAMCLCVYYHPQQKLVSFYMHSIPAFLVVAYHRFMHRLFIVMFTGSVLKLMAPKRQINDESTRTTLHWKYISIEWTTNVVVIFIAFLRLRIFTLWSGFRSAHCLRFVVVIFVVSFYQNKLKNRTLPACLMCSFGIVCREPWSIYATYNFFGRRCKPFQIVGGTMRDALSYIRVDRYSVSSVQWILLPTHFLKVNSCWPSSVFSVHTVLGAECEAFSTYPLPTAVK